MKEKRVKKSVEYIAVLITSLIFYLFWCFLDGVYITPDAETYIHMEMSREPGYCMYLAFFRWILGEQNYLFGAIVGQSIIAAMTATALYKELKVRFSLGKITAVLILLIQYGVTLLNRFVAQRRSGYFNSIETEGLAYSLWILFFLALIRILYDKSKKDVVLAFVWSVILVSIRKQMYIAVILLFMTYIYAYCKKNKRIKIIFQSVVLCIGVLIVSNLIDCSYNFVLRGKFQTHSGDASFILGTEIFVADNDMVKYIKDSKNQEYFSMIMSSADEQKFNICYADSNWMSIEDKYSESYDNIKFRIINPLIHDDLRAAGIEEGLLTEKYNEIIHEMMSDLLVPCIPGIIKLYWCNVLSGLITTVLKVNVKLNLIAILEYICYLIVCIWILKKGKKNTSSVLPLAILVLLAILVNILFTSTTIYCQMRYMQYCTALFYQVGLVMLIEVNRTRKVK